MKRKIDELLFLPKRQRQIWIMKGKGARVTDIAKALGINVSAVCATLKSAKESIARLNKSVQEREDV